MKFATTLSLHLGDLRPEGYEREQRRAPLTNDDTSGTSCPTAVSVPCSLMLIRASPADFMH